MLIALDYPGTGKPVDLGKRRHKFFGKVHCAIGVLQVRIGEKQLKLYVKILGLLTESRFQKVARSLRLSFTQIGPAGGCQCVGRHRRDIVIKRLEFIDRRGHTEAICQRNDAIVTKARSH